ncbi:hypothetical protein ACTXLQ_00490 [Enterococcus hirae]|uniref:hypothetical protein n=1 Tax=Enterococcus hirae TaxID=1354 RepID=UPI0019DBDF90|nr:hypothetical protein [Enterococcus faecium]EMF0080446.1 hypothetical protein [Enterococcus hirae]EMF0233583.1 hypothetical protein [Enterococcus hirae]EMF0238989.1 hypothetical protein [Enterococcus hirae]EMF0390463.1 hypothetical protein [Enterococcus hirae]
MLKTLFWDHSGDFQWASVAAGIALIGAISSAIFSWLSYRTSVKTAEKQHEMEQKKIDADIISKSRMHWIDNTKDIASEFLVDTLRATAITKLSIEKLKEIHIFRAIEFENGEKLKTEETDKKQEYLSIDDTVKRRINSLIEFHQNNTIEINKLINDISKNYTLLKLNFSDNDGNSTVIELIDKINNDIRSFVRVSNQLQKADAQTDWDEKIKEARTTSETINDEVNKLTILLRDYYKKEWEKVKSGE